MSMGGKMHTLACPLHTHAVLHISIIVIQGVFYKYLHMGLKPQGNDKRGRR
jgi:hypothetical protein